MSDTRRRKPLQDRDCVRIPASWLKSPGLSRYTSAVCWAMPRSFMNAIGPHAIRFVDTNMLFLMVREGHVWEDVKGLLRAAGQSDWSGMVLENFLPPNPLGFPIQFVAGYRVIDYTTHPPREQNEAELAFVERNRQRLEGSGVASS